MEINHYLKISLRLGKRQWLNLFDAYIAIHLVLNAHSAQIPSADLSNHNDDIHRGSFFVQDKAILPMQFHLYFHLNGYAHRHQDIPV